MKRILCVLLTFVLLTGCSGENREMTRCIALREQLLVSGCSFVGDITADFGDKVYTFSLNCTADSQGALSFSFIFPEEIADIGGIIHAGKGKLEYQDTVLAFPLLAEGEVSPVSAPWLLINGLRSGYLASCGKNGNEILLTVHDNYEEDALLLEVWLSEDIIPLRTDILWKGRRVLSMVIKDFRFV